jgi:hypothetical protein
MSPVSFYIVSQISISGAVDAVELQSRLTVFGLRDVVSISTSRSRDGLETYPRFRLGLVSDNLANVSVSVLATGLNVSVSVSRVGRYRAHP